MADVTKVKASDGTIYDINDVDDYTKDETDALLAGKADVGVSYTKAEDDALLAAKADASDVAAELALKANVVDVYSKTEADNLLAGKADTGVSYTKAEDDALLAGKADAGVSYTKAEDDALLADKANAADVYTITQTDALLDTKAGVDDSSITATMATWSASKLAPEFQGKADSSDVYTKAEVDALIGGIKMIPLLDWANPIWTSSSASDSYTATGKCYLYGWIQGGSEVAIRVNGGEVSIKTAIYSTDAAATPFPIELVAGDVVTFNDATTYLNKVHVYVERS